MPREKVALIFLFMIQIQFLPVLKSWLELKSTSLEKNQKYVQFDLRLNESDWIIYG